MVMDGRFLEATWMDTASKRVGTEMFGWDAANKIVKVWGSHGVDLRGYLDV